MNKSFNCKRFWTYFKYDLVQMWRNNGRAVLVIGGLGLITYVVFVLGSLFFAPHVWQAPSMSVRFTMFQCSLFALYLFQTRSYGYLTDKRAGSSWLMLPVSTCEKYLSMMLICLVVLPFGFLVAQLGIDALLVLADPTCKGSLLVDGIRSVSDAVNMPDTDNALILPPAILSYVLGLFCGLTYFLLGGLVFKKWKITGSVAVLFGVMLVSMFVLGLVTQPDGFWEMDKIRTLLWGITGCTALVWVALMACVYFRIKNLKH